MRQNAVSVNKQSPKGNLSDSLSVEGREEGAESEQASDRLRLCPDCGKSVSKRAFQCPRRGCPVEQEIESKDDDDQDISHELPHRAGTVLSMGILTLLFAFFCPLVCWIVGGIGLNMANTDLSLMAKDKIDCSGVGTTNTGRVLAILGLILGTINAIIGAFMLSAK